MDDSDIANAIYAMNDGSNPYGGGYATPGAASPTPAGNWSGLLQQAMSIGGQYLSKSLDIDLATRLAGNQAVPIRYSNQTPVYATVGGNADLTTRGVAAVGGMRMGDLLPIGLGVLFLFMMFGGKR